MFKKPFYLKLLSVMIILTLTSCSDDDSFSLETENSNDTQMRGSFAEPILSDGILTFNTATDFENFIETYIDEDLKEVYDAMEPFYEQGFYSLRPPAIEGYHEAKIIRQYENRVTNFKKNYNINNYNDEQIYEKIDQTSDIILLDIFAAIINNKGELKIADNFYKFTDAGLFAVKEKDSQHLKDYLNNNNIANNLLNKTSIDVIEYYVNNFSGDTPINLNGRILYTSTPPISEEPGHGGGGYNPPGNPGNNQNNGALDGLANYLDNKEICYGSHSLLGQIFGDHRVCKDYYSGGNKRVRTEVFNYNLQFPFTDINLFVTGVKVKNQKSLLGWGIMWNRTKADVVALGVEMFQVTFDYSSVLEPNVYQGFYPNAVSYSYKPSNMSYEIQTNLWTSGFPQYNLNFSAEYPQYPNFIQDGLVIEGIGNNYIGNLIQNGINENLAGEELNKQFWDNVYRISKSQLQGLVDTSYEHPSGVSLVSNYPNQGVVMLQKTYYSNCNNCKKRSKTLLFGGSGGISVGYDGYKGKFKYDVSASGTTPINPENVRFVVYGAVKEGGTWYGDKMEAFFD